MSLVVLILFPLGAMIMRIFGKWWLHAIFQVIALILLIVGFALGVILGKMEGRVRIRRIVVKHKD
jgi:multisubunit Na+/H+ antiporter MnhF subunit